MFFSVVLFSNQMHKIREKKLTGKKINLDREIFKDVICILVLIVT